MRRQRPTLSKEGLEICQNLLKYREMRDKILVEMDKIHKLKEQGHI